MLRHAAGRGNLGGRTQGRVSLFEGKNEGRDAHTKEGKETRLDVTVRLSL